MAQLPKGHEIDKSWFEEIKDVELYGRSPVMDALPTARLMTAIDMARAADNTVLVVRESDGRIKDGYQIAEYPSAASKVLKTFSQKMDQDIIQALAITTVSNAQAQPTNLSVDILNNALRILGENKVPVKDPHMTANEVQLRMQEYHGNFVRRRDEMWGVFAHDLFMHGAAAMFVPGGTKKIPRPHEPDEFHWMANLPGMLKRGAFTAWLLNDKCKVWDESDRMGHCLFRSYLEDMEEGEYIAYHVDAPHLFKNGFTVTMELKSTVKWKDVPALTNHRMTFEAQQEKQEWIVDQVRGKANSTSRDGALQLFVDHLALEVNNAWKAMHKALKDKKDA